MALYVLWTRILGWDSYVSPVYRLLEYSFGMWLRAFVARKEMKQELCPCANVVAVILLLLLIRMGIPAWVEILLFGGVITMLASFSSRLSDSVLGNKIIVGLAKADMFIYLTHPGIAFHLVMFCFGHNAWLMVAGSVVVGYVMWRGFNFMLTQISQISQNLI